MKSFHSIVPFLEHVVLGSSYVLGGYLLFGASKNELTTLAGTVSMVYGVSNLVVGFVIHLIFILTQFFKYFRNKEVSEDECLDDDEIAVGEEMDQELIDLLEYDKEKFSNRSFYVNLCLSLALWAIVIRVYY